MSSTTGTSPALSSSSSLKGLLIGKVAVMTGSSHGLGAAMAKHLAANGAIVTTTSIMQAAKAVMEKIKKAGGKAHTFKANISMHNQVFTLINEVICWWGCLNVFINNLGLAKGKPLNHLSETKVDQIFRANFKGMLWGLQAAAKELKLGGSIINISSVLANKFNPEKGIYGALKLAVDHITKTAAKELGSKGIHINVVTPGIIPMDMTKNLPLKNFAKQMPLEHRVSTPEEIINVVAFLASPQASWVTGEIITLIGTI